MRFRPGFILPLALWTLGAAAPVAKSPASAPAKAPAKASTKGKGKVVKKAPPAPPPGPAWAQKLENYVQSPARAFVAVGQAGDAAAAEDDARQHLGSMVAAWQERALKCGMQASEQKVTANNANLKGSLVSVEISREISVALYKDEVGEKAAQDGKQYVQVRHSLESMMQGIEYDTGRSDGLRAAVKVCGEKAFDALAIPPAPLVVPDVPRKGK
jgi:hypothetical protein